MFRNPCKSRNFRKKGPSEADGAEDAAVDSGSAQQATAPAASTPATAPPPSLDQPAVASSQLVATPAAPKPKQQQKPTASATLSFGDEEGDAEAPAAKAKIKPFQLAMDRGAVALSSTAPTPLAAAYGAKSGEYTAEKLSQLKKNSFFFVSDRIEKPELEAEEQQAHKAASGKHVRFAEEPAQAAAPTPMMDIVAGDEAEQATVALQARSDPLAQLDALRKGTTQDETQPDTAENAIPPAEKARRARERREKRREAGGEEFIPLDDKAEDKQGSRLVQEDEHDEDEEEFDEYRGRKIAFGKNAQKSKKERIAEAAAAGDEEEDEDLQRWEVEQMKKGGGRKLTSAQAALVARAQALPVAKTELPAAFAAISIDDHMNKLQEAVLRLKERHAHHAREKAEAAQSRAESAKLEAELTGGFTMAARKFEFFQELRAFVADLLDCLAEKAPQIQALEDRLARILRDSVHALAAKDASEAEDEIGELRESLGLAPLPLERPPASPVHELRLNRRLLRDLRRKEKATAGQAEEEGWSSDEEPTPDVADRPPVADPALLQLEQQRRELLQEAATLFGDAAEEFADVEAVARRLEAWKHGFFAEYRDAYAPLSIPQLLAPYIRLELLAWDPLRTGQALDELRGVQVLFGYGLPKDGSAPEPGDDDALLLPRLVEKAVAPRAAVHLAHRYDPFSRAQTARALKLFAQFLDEPLPILRQLSAAVLEALAAAVGRAASPLPVFPRGSPLASRYTLRVLWRTVKLLRNLCAWTPYLSGPTLQSFAIGNLFAHKIAPLLLAQPADRVAEYAARVLDAFPEAWLSSLNISGGWTPFRQFVAEALKRLERGAKGRPNALALVALLRRVGEADAARTFEERLAANT